MNHYQLKINGLTLFILLTASIFSCSKKQRSDASEINLSHHFPSHDIDYSGSEEDVQSELEKLAWDRFVAIVWPAKGGLPEPDTSKNILEPGDANALFENYGLNYDIYLLPGEEKPVSWGNWEARARQRSKRWQTACAAATLDPNAIVLDEFIQAGLEPAPHFPLIDEKGEYVWTTVMYNQELYDYVVKQALYSQAGLVAMMDSLSPYESSDQVAKYRLDAPDGSLMLKASWKVLSPRDDGSTFYATTANLIFENHNRADIVGYQCRKEIVGLVGLHVTYKAPGQPYWIWSTFEHRNNAPDANTIDPEKTYNFFSLENPSASPLVNHPSEPTDTNTEAAGNPYWFDPGKGRQRQNLIIRELPIREELEKLNAEYQKALSGSVWENYMQVGTQWAAEGNRFVPQVIANTTLESFEQNQASCMGCHNMVSGFGNDSVQVALGNHAVLGPPLLVDTADGIRRELRSDMMWSSYKYAITGYLSWHQIR